ncbi:hypothetical protein Poly30_50770 [Planctomycetes bacterium Poly30]|uniref:DUF1565 domain-containing protein n=1 Tax=Saltatorellus ferox TaxID=2528018 RepID=A0A518EZM4_9BACT|nr:hypothetical protein Poly30_50770 [Planctomycetes bacterium Poly30]
MPIPMLRLAVLLLAGSIATGQALAQRIWVDAVHGSDSNDGLTLATAFKTLTKAMEGSDQPPNRHVNVRPGIYDGSNGESFPIEIGTYRRVFGSNGAIIDGGGASVAVRAAGSGFSPPQKLYDFEIRHAGLGLELTKASILTQGLHVHDCDIGVRGSYQTTLSGPTSLGISSSLIEDCRVGVETFGSTRFASGLLKIRNIQEDGLRMHWSGTTAGAGLAMSRVCIEDCGDAAVRVQLEAPDPLDLSVEACLLTDCGIGLVLDDPAGQGQFGGYVRRLTLASHRIGLTAAYSASSTLRLRGILLADNVLDVDAGTTALDIEDSLLEGGQYAGAPGVIQGDPSFVHAAGKDYALRAGSPAIDGIRSQPYYLSIPSFNQVDTSDGDLDARVGDDIGALEFATLRGSDVTASGAPYEVQVFGKPGTTAQLFTARTFPAVIGTYLRTPSGLQGLDPDTLRLLGTVTVPSGGAPGVLQIPISSDPALIGTSLFLQAALPSSASPTGMAWSNRLRALIQAP